MASNSIGPYEFIVLDPPPEPPKEDVDIVQREGVIGIAAWLTGRRGHAHISRSKVDARDRNHAWELFQGYLALKGTVQQCVSGNHGLVTEGFAVLVRDVRNHSIKRIGASSGGLNPPNTYWLEADWELWAVDL